jgi:hypothetical protein
MPQRGLTAAYRLGQFADRQARLVATSPEFGPVPSEEMSRGSHDSIVSSLPVATLTTLTSLTTRRARKPGAHWGFRPPASRP